MFVCVCLYTGIYHTQKAQSNNSGNVVMNAQQTAILSVVVNDAVTSRTYC